MSEEQTVKQTPAAPIAKSKKRRHHQRDPETGAKKRKRAAAFEEDEEYLDLETGVNKKIGLIDNLLLADHLAKKVRRFGTGLTPVELSRLDISPSYITDTTSFLKTRNLENLPEFLEKFADAKKLGEAPKTNGSPHTLIVTSAGLRAADIVRSVRKYQSKDSAVAKLFAKHIKVKESVEFLEKSRTGIAVGTPVRLYELVENSALKLDNLERLVIDASHIDQKKRGVMDMKDTMLPLARWLARPEFKERYIDAEKPLQLLFF
ncbi:U3-containing 90S pre-ribosomal complex subunit-domain containing protein [Hypoxylon cercidicola]|nr:U3-containing 90S pre-ribosomal complex subunit-domain containing protein [Hypoxylon cercidicola]